MPGLAIMAIPLFVLTVGDARLSAGWLLPVLLTADLFAIVYYRRHAAANRLFTLFPWVVIGLAAGAYALGYPEQLLRTLVGCILLGMMILYWLRTFKVPGAIFAVSRYHAREVRGQR